MNSVRGQDGEKTLVRRHDQLANVIGNRRLDGLLVGTWSVIGRISSIVSCSVRPTYPVSFRSIVRIPIIVVGRVGRLSLDAGPRTRTRMFCLPRLPEVGKISPTYLLPDGDEDLGAPAGYRPARSRPRFLAILQGGGNPGIVARLLE